MGHYECGCNVFWLKETHLSQPGVPMNERSIEVMKESRYKTPTRFVDPFVVAVPEGAKGQGVQVMFGNLELLSPEECFFALLLRIKERIEQGADEEELQEWRVRCLTCTFSFETTTTAEEKYWRAVNLREKVVGDFEALARDVPQRIMELVSYKQLMKKVHNKDLSNEALAEAWASEVNQVDSRLSDKVTKNFVDTAMKVYNRLMFPDILEIIMEDTRVHGKGSPFNSLSSLEQITMKCKSQDQMKWVVQGIHDSLVHLPSEFGVGAFSFRQLKGSGGSVGQIALFLAKQEIFAHFKSTYVSKIPRDEFKEMISTEMCSHVSFRNLLGAPGHDAHVDKSWLGGLCESENFAVNFIKNVVYNGVHDGLLKSILKASSSIEDIFASEKMIELTTEMMDALEAELHPGSRDISGLVPLCPEACPTLEELVGDAVLAVAKADELKEHLAHIKDYIARFVTFVVTSDSVSKSKQVLEGTVLPKFPVRNEKYWAIFYDTKSAGESSAQPGSRFPAYQKKTLKKEIHSAVGAHGQEDLGETCIVMIMDGFRSLEAQFSKDLVNVHGDAMTKQRQTFQVAYDEKALRARKCLSRGLIPQVEGLHVYSTEPLCLQDKDRKTYMGSTHGTLIGPVQVVPYKDAWLVSKPTKDEMLGADGKILAGGPCPDPVTLPAEVGEKVPASYHPMPMPFYAELIHSFQLGGCYDATCLDICFAMAALKNKMPYIGCVLTETAKEMMEGEVLRKTWAEFTTPGSELYDQALTELLNQDGNATGTKKAAAKGKAKSRKTRAKAGEDEVAEEEEEDEVAEVPEPKPKKPRTTKPKAGTTEAGLMAALAGLGDP